MLLWTCGEGAAATAANWGALQPGAKIVKTSDLPPILTHDEAITLDAKFSKYRALAAHAPRARKHFCRRPAC